MLIKGEWFLVDEKAECFGQGEIEVGWVSGLGCGVPGAAAVLLSSRSITVLIRVLASQRVETFESRGKSRGEHQSCILEVVGPECAHWKRGASAFGEVGKGAHFGHEPHGSMFREEEEVRPAWVASVGWVFKYEFGSGLDAGSEYGAGSRD